MLLAVPGRVMAEEISETKPAAEQTADSENNTDTKEKPDASQDTVRDMLPPLLSISESGGSMSHVYLTGSGSIRPAFFRL